MTTINVKSTGIRVYSTNDSVRYRMQLNTTIDGIQLVNGQYVDTKVDYVDFHPSVLVAQVINLVPGVDILYTKKKEQALRAGNNSGFGAAELQIVLRDATIELERAQFVAGEEYETSDGTKKVHEHDGWNTTIKNIKVSEKTQMLLDKVVDAVFGL